MSSSGLMSSLDSERTCYIGMPVNVSSRRSNQLDQISDTPTKHLNGNAPGKKTFPGSRRIFWIALWVIGAIILGAAAFLVHNHTNPWPVELAFTKNIQGPHPVPCPI